MIVKFDSFSHFEPLIIALCNPGSVVDIKKNPSRSLGFLNNVFDTEIQFNFNAVSELSFRIYDVEDEDPEVNANGHEIFAGVMNRRLLFVKDIGYFKITKCKKTTDNNGQIYKDVTASSIESELEDRALPYIEDNTYKFDDLLETLVAALPNWTIGSVAPAIYSKYRSFEDVSTDSNILNFMLEEMQDAYECIFIFDTTFREIYVYDQNDYVRKTDIHLTIDDVINQMEVDENAEDVYTALRAIGSDDAVVISPCNPLGGNLMYCFDYFLDWMQPDLSAKVKRWQEDIALNEDGYYNANQTYYSTEQSILDAKQELAACDSRISVYTKLRENVVANPDTNLESYKKVLEELDGIDLDLISEEITTLISTIDNELTKERSAKANKQLLINSLQGASTSAKSAVEAIRNQLTMNNYFTDTERAELQAFIYEGSYSDDYVTITESMNEVQKLEQSKVLYDRAKKMLYQTSRPKCEYTIDAQNFLFVEEFKNWSDQLETGCIINVELEEGDVAPLFLSNITVNYSDLTLSMTFGNRFIKFDPKSLFKDVLGKINKTSNSIGYVKNILYPIKHGEFDYMKDALASSRVLTAKDSVASNNNLTSVDEYGFTSRQLTSTGDIDPRQVKLTGRNLVFTDDAWESAKVAIGELTLSNDTKTYGINAETVYGDMIVGGGLRIVDENGNDMLSVTRNGITTSVGEAIEDIRDDLGSGNYNAYTMDIASSNGLIFKSDNYSTNLTANIFRGNKKLEAADITEIGTVKWFIGNSPTSLTGLTITTPATNAETITYTAKLIDKDNHVLIQSSVTLGKIVDGISISSVTEYYAINNSLVTPPAKSSFQTDVVTPTKANRYLWSFSRTSFSVGEDVDSEMKVICIYGQDGANGANGANGASINTITDYYRTTTSAYPVPTMNKTDWSTSIAAVLFTATNKYLWNYEEITYTNSDKISHVEPRIIGIYGDKGETGAGVDHIETYFLLDQKQYYNTTSAPENSSQGDSPDVSTIIPPVPPETTDARWTKTPPSEFDSEYWLWTMDKTVYDLDGVQPVFSDPILDPNWNATNYIYKSLLDQVGLVTSTVSTLRQDTDNISISVSGLEQTTKNQSDLIGITPETFIYDLDNDDLISGYFQDNNGVGNTATGFVSNSGWTYLKQNSKQGDKYVISSAQGDSTALIWAFLDANDVILSAIDSSVTSISSDTEIVAPANTSYIVFNNQVGTNFMAKRYESLPPTIWENITAVKRTTNEIRTDINTTVFSRVKEIEGGLSKIEEAVIIDGAKITLQTNQSQLKLVLENDQIAFVYHDTEVMKITDKRIDITIGNFEQINLGNFVFIPRDNGSLDFKGAA